MLIDWGNYYREQCMWELYLATQSGPNQQLMGGSFERVQIDESYFRGKLKRVWPGISNCATFSEMIAPMPAKTTVTSSTSLGYFELCGTDLMVNA